MKYQPHQMIQRISFVGVFVIVLLCAHWTVNILHLFNMKFQLNSYFPGRNPIFAECIAHTGSWINETWPNSKFGCCVKAWKLNITRDTRGGARGPKICKRCPKLIKYWFEWSAVAGVQFSGNFELTWNETLSDKTRTHTAWIEKFVRSVLILFQLIKMYLGSASVCECVSAALSYAFDVHPAGLKLYPIFNFVLSCSSHCSLWC